MTRSNRTAKISIVLIATALFSVVGCAADDSVPEVDDVETSAATQSIKLPAGARFVVPRGLAVVIDSGLVLVSTVSEDPSTGGEQGKSCPFQGAKKTVSGDTACGYNNNQQWVCCDGTCDYTCNINQHNNMQYWNTDSCTVVESSCQVRSGGPGGGGFDILQTQGSGG